MDGRLPVMIDILGPDGDHIDTLTNK